MDNKQVMQQALEALDLHPGNYTLTQDESAQIDVVIAALRAALAAQPQQSAVMPEFEVVAWHFHGAPPDGPHACAPKLQFREPSKGWAVRDALIRKFDVVAFLQGGAA